MDPALRQEAAALDAVDPLRPFADRFYRQPGAIYLDGNSLGLLSRDAEASLLRTLEEWKRLAVEGWTEADPPWFFSAEELAKRVAALVGAQSDEVIVTGSTTVNLHQLLATLYRPQGTRTKVLVDALAFPSDVFAVESHLQLRGLDPIEHLVKVPSRDGRTLDEGDIVASLTDDVAVAVLPAVVFTSGQLLDMAGVTAEARRRGILIGWDCSHSVGAVPHRLSEWNADFAFWCHYKYLNAGPGAVGGLYLNRQHFGRAPGLAGWFSSAKERQFDMGHELTPAAGAGALQIGTPHLLSQAPLFGALALHHEAGMDRLRAKSLALTAFLRRLVEARLSGFGVGIVTPIEDDRRGGHLALTHPDGASLCRALRSAGVIPDHRPPDIIRLAPVPLYNSFADCAEAVGRLAAILERGGFVEQASRGLVP